MKIQQQTEDAPDRNWFQRILAPQFLKRLLERGIPFPVIAFACGALVFAFGWLWAWRISFSRDYLATRAIWIACFNISWVLGSVFWGLRWLPTLIDGLQKCFGNVTYDEFASRWKLHFLRDQWMLLCTVVVFAFGATTIYVAKSYPVTGNEHRVFQPSWFSGQPFALLLAIGLCASLATGSGMSLFVVNVPFVFALRKLPVVSIPNMLLAKLRPLSDFYVAGTLAWFVAVGLTAFILFPNLSSTALWFLLVTTVMGLSGFVVPQVVFHLLLVRSQSQMADHLYGELQIWERSAPVQPSSKLKELNDTLKANSLWVFDIADITSLLIPELISAIGLILKSGIVGQHS
jgi:hypothetical protein